MRHLSRNNRAQMGMVGAAVGLLITLIIVVLIYYNIAASTQHSVTGTVHQKSMWNASNNATTSINSQAATFFTIAPIIAIVIVAVVVIGYVQKIGG